MKKEGKGRLRVFFAEFEGNDSTIQEGLRSIAQAVNKTFEAKTKIVRILPGDTSSADPVVLEDLTEDLDEGQDHEEEGTGDARDVSRTRRKPPTMTLVKELNLRQEGKQSLREFFAQKGPSNQTEMIAVFVYYLATILETPEITPHHVFTCFKDVGERFPKDLPQAIRNTASRKAWVDSRDQKDIKITNHGENFVEHDLLREPASE